MTISRSGSSKIVATYDYVKERGSLLFQVCRLEPKTFNQRRRARPEDPTDKVKDGWVWSVKDVVPKVPFRLPELIEALALEHRVFIVEGEKDVDRLARMAWPRLATRKGAKWRDEFADHLIGAMLPSCRTTTTPGRAHTSTWPAHSSARRRASAWSNCPACAEKGDVSEWFDAGGTVEAFNTYRDQPAHETHGSALPRDVPIERRIRDGRRTASNWLCFIDQRYILGAIQRPRARS